MLNDEVSGRFFDLRSSLVDGKAHTAESTILYATIDIKIPFQRRFEREKCEVNSPRQGLLLARSGRAGA